MCTGPFKCPDCKTWWVGPEHRCPPDDAPGVPMTPFTPPRWPVPSQIVGGFSSHVRCTCPANRGDNYSGICMIHDVQITYTSPLVRGTYVTGGAFIPWQE